MKAKLNKNNVKIIIEKEKIERKKDKNTRKEKQEQDSR